MGATTAGTMLLPVNNGEAVVIEIFDDPQAIPVSQPARIAVGWVGSTDAQLYEIQFYLDGNWLTQKTILESGKFYYAWNSPRLADSETHSYRLKTTNRDGSVVIGENISISIARHPDPPPVTLTLNEDLTITVS